MPSLILHALNGPITLLSFPPNVFNATVTILLNSFRAPSACSVITRNFARNMSEKSAGKYSDNKPGSYDPLGN
jgi:hypothetical protein